MRRENNECYSIISNTDEMWNLFKERIEKRKELLYPGTIYTFTFDNTNFNIVRVDWDDKLTFTEAKEEGKDYWMDKCARIAPAETGYHNADLSFFGEQAVALWNGELAAEKAFVNGVISISERTFLERVAVLVTILEDIPDTEVTNILAKAYDLKALPAIEG